jgi:hypothetical protein
MSDYLLNDELPGWFEIPKSYSNIIKEGCLENEDYDFGPSWQLLFGQWQEVRFNGLKKRYPERSLYPFARRVDDDDVACFDLADESNPPRVVIIHDFAGPGWEYRGSFDNFEAWLEAAKNEVEEDREE